MTSVGQKKFNDIKEQVDKTKKVLDYPRCVADDDPDFVVMKVRSDQFKKFVTSKWSKMNAGDPAYYKGGDTPMKEGDTPMKEGDTPMKEGDTPMKEGGTPMKEVCMKHPPCISSVHEYIPVLVPSFLMKRKPLTWMSALAEFPDLKDVTEDRQKEYYELLCEMVKAYQKVVVEHHDPFQELKINDPDRKVPYGGPDGTPWVPGNTGVDAITDAPKPPPSNKEMMREIHIWRVSALRNTVTSMLETWFENRQGVLPGTTKPGDNGFITTEQKAWLFPKTPGFMEDYGFKKDLTINGFVTMVINQAATIGTHTWGKATVMCNTLEIKQDGYKDLHGWLETYAEAFVKLHDGQYAVSHNHHLTEDEHTVQVATAIWIIDQ
ncbi:hypothetical protein T484DRAFT_1758542, partial [Baffinella frigidus]